MAEYKLKQGFDIRLVGEPEKTITDAEVPETVALTTSDFKGVKYKLLVREGDQVKIGTPLCRSKSREDWTFSATTSGTVEKIVRGHRRSLQSIIIKSDGNNQALKYDSHDPSRIAKLPREEVLSQVLQSGLMWMFKQRPFDNLADPDVIPRDIFVSCFDSSPLGVDYNLLVDGNESFFQAGIDVCSVLTNGNVHLGVDGNTEKVNHAFAHARNAKIHRFTGKHPAGVVGVQIHHIKPIAHRKDVVWTITVSNLIQLGKLFLLGHIDPNIIVALAGSSINQPQYFRTRLGAEVKSIISQSNLNDDPEKRFISGNVLTGKQIDYDEHVHAYDNLLTVIPETVGPEFVGWMLPGMEKQSIYKAFLSHMFPGKKFVQNTRLNGGRRAFISSNVYKSVMPMDIFPLYLVKSCLAQDIEEMESLGIYEVTEEEVALCEYVCPSKMDIQQIIRGGLDLIEKEG